MTRRRLAVAAIALVASGCPRAHDSKPPRGPASLQLAKQQLLHAGISEDVVGKLAKSRFRYFRMLGEQFELRTCEAFRDHAPALPVTPIHGDAHLEQFVVTATTYGLEDFDRAGFGPAVLDLVRYAASLHVACADVAWPCDSNAAVARFLAAYRESLAKAPPQGDVPAVVERLRAKAPASRASWLAWADKLMTPLPPAIDADVRRSWASFSNRMLKIQPDWPASMYGVQGLGALRIGFGSALERKVLIRIAGPTASPDDDLFVEIREGIAPTGPGCIWRASYGESLILMFTSILGRRMPEVHGFAPLLGSTRHFWIQSWDPGYGELSVHDIASQAELEQLAVDAARQLGGHLWTNIPERLRNYQRHAQLEAFDITRTRVVEVARTLADESNAGWERFRAQ